MLGIPAVRFGMRVAARRTTAFSNPLVRPPMNEESPPSVAGELTRKIGAIARIGACNRPTFSPDGSAIAFVSDLSGSPQVWKVATKGGWPEQLTAFDDPVLDAVWSPTGEWIGFMLAPGGGMNGQIYIIRPDGTGLQRLTRGGSTNSYLNCWSRDGRLLGYSTNQRDPARLEAVAVEISTGAVKDLGQAPGTGDVFDFAPDGTTALTIVVAQRSNSNLHLVDVATGEAHVLTPHSGAALINRARFAPDSSTIYLSCNLDSEFLYFARMKLDAHRGPRGLEVLAARAGADLEAFDVAVNGKRAVLFWNVAGRCEVEFLELESGKRTKGPDAPGEIVDSPVFSHDGQALAASFTGAVSPWDLWVLDAGRPAFRQLTSSPHAGVRLEELVRPDLLPFAGADGLPLSGWLYRPRGSSAPGPLVISFHGGPECQERPYINATYQALLIQGIAVFAPNVRGSSGFGKTFVNLDNGPLRVNAVRDIGACVRAVVDAGVADPARIGVMGGSYGGFMTMAALTEFPDLFAAGVDLFGIVNFETFFAHCEPWMSAISKVEYGDPDTQRDMLRALSPIHKIDRVRAPTLVLHGANDTNVPVIEAQQVEAELRRRNVEVELILFPDEGHGFVKTANRIRSTTEIVRWFALHLGKTPASGVH
ncbi:MAG: S9 family peptidase [Thermoplasmata archaeon]|nr:S9 family peptidase [Thermoplasmata archaeon]